MSKYVVPTWKKWSSIYCSRCFKWLGNYKGWYQIQGVELYCKKCTEEIQHEQQTEEKEGIS